MNIDKSASTGSTKTDEPATKALDSAPTTTTGTTAEGSSSEPKPPNAPIISVSAPEGGEELRFNQPFKAAHTGNALHFQRVSASYHRSRPHPDQDLIKLYGLGGLEASVARVDPKTGEKINRLRKSYEGQIKSFGLAGRNKAVQHDYSTDGLSLLQLTQWPEEEFTIQRMLGKEVGKGLSDATKAKLERAVDLKPGKVSKNAEWESALGHEKRAMTDDIKGKKPEIQKDTVQPSVVPVKVNGHINGTTSVPETNRPRRVSKKRSYVDSSFEGYGETFDDDAQDDDSSNEGSRRSSNPRNKRRKSSNNGPSSFGSGSYGPPSQPAPLSRGISSHVSFVG